MKTRKRIKRSEVLKSVFPGFKSKTIMFLLLLALAINANAQHYMYVRDNDLFVNVRGDTTLQSSIVDTLYNLQIVQVNDQYSANGWMYVEAGGKDGYVHESRLVKMPDEYHSILDSIWLNQWYEYYIASVDCPEILVEVMTDKRNINNNHRWMANDASVCFLSNSIVIRNMKTGAELDNTDIILETDISLHTNRMLFSNYAYTYSFYRNQRNKLCRGLFFLESIDLPKLNEKELSSVLEQAKKAFDGVGQFKTNDFDYLIKLENAYFNGNEEAKKLYPYVLIHMPLDGDGSHTIVNFVTRFWGFNNRGEIELE